MTAGRTDPVATWSIPTMGLLLDRHGLPCMPSVILLFGTVARLRPQAAAKVELPSPAGAG